MYLLQYERLSFTPITNEKEKNFNSETCDFDRGEWRKLSHTRVHRVAC